VIFDTNVLIYLSKYQIPVEKLSIDVAGISIISKIEILGYQFKNIEEHDLLTEICNIIEVVPLSDEIADATIKLRQKHRIKTPDAIIYATALVKNVPLLTNNIKDFISLDENVKLINPFDL